MAMMSVCLEADCVVISPARYCPAHRRSRRRRPSAAQRGYGRGWRKLRAAVLRATPRCRSCGGPATEVDHIVPLRAGGSHALANLQPLCKPCHSSKTARLDTPH